MKSCLTKEKKISKKKTVCTTKTQDDGNYFEKRRFLYLMRHAKASKEYETYAERDRPLIKRGKKDAKIMKKFIESMHMHPETCFVSPSVRTRETFDVIKGAFPDATVSFDEDVYEETEDIEKLIEKIRSVPDACNEVLILGHLTNLPILAKFLSNQSLSDEDALKRMGKKFPTASLVVLELPAGLSWKELAEGVCRLVLFVRPKDLKG